MKRSRTLVIACSAALMGAWATQGAAEQKSSSQSKQPAQGAQAQIEQQRQSKHGQVAQKAGQAKNVLIVGKITDARDVTLASTAGDKHRLLKVQPENGKEVVVDLGVPQGGVTEANLKKGDHIIAIGKPARINGRPVLFAANIAEMHSVGRASGQAGQSTTMQSSSTQGGQQRSGAEQSAMSANQQSGAKQSAGSQQSAQSSAQRTGSASQDDIDAVIYLFETDNMASDDYGVYDEDFAWETRDRTYDTWNDGSIAWDDTERAHFDMFGYDDAGEEGVFDW